jgi:hypothetical protein
MVTLLSKPETAQEPPSHQWAENWAERLGQTGLDVIVLPLLEIGRGLGVLGSNALLFVEPLLAGIVGERNIKRYVALLEDPAALEDLINRLEGKAEGDG